jgi:hypothetical protein
MTTTDRQRTAAAMYTTAAELEETEATMHRRADAIPDQAARSRLHDVADQVTETATDIAHRADQVTETDRDRQSAETATDRDRPAGQMPPDQE